MRMGIVTAILCLHMLLWAGCHAALSSHKLGSDEILLRNSHPSKVVWRKLLVVNASASASDVIKAETTNASVTTESENVGAKDARTQSAEKADVLKENVVLDAQTDPASLNAHQEGVKPEIIPAHTSTSNITTEEEEPKSQEVPKEEQQTDADIIEPKESGNHTIETKQIEKTENSTADAIAQSHAEENPTPSANADDAKVSEKGVETEENVQQTSPKSAKEEEAASEKTDVEENKEGSDVVKDEVVEEDKSKSMPEQKDGTPSDVQMSGADQQETSTKETGSVVESTEAKEEPTEDNPIKMVESNSGAKQIDSNDDTAIKMVQSSEPEGIEKGRIVLDSLASIEEQGSSNITDSSNREVSNPSDIKVEESDGDVSNPIDVKVEDEKTEEKDESNIENTEIAEEKGEEGNTEEVSQVKSSETREEKHESTDDNTEPKDKEGENKDTEEALQVKSEEKAEENHESSEEKAADNHEASEEKAAENDKASEENAEVKDKEGEGNDADEVSQAKTDDETQAVAKEVESQLEALKRDTDLDTTSDQRQERDPSDDEYDIIQELADLPTKFQQTAGKVADHLRPDLLRWTDTSKEYFNLANQQISESFSPLIGRQYAPFFASMISYGILLLPLLVVILLFEHIKALFSLQKVLLFINIYLAAYFATLWLASFIIGLEPMSFFYHNSLSSYLSLQLLQGLGYVVYLILQTANMINSCTSETRVGKVTSWLQWAVAIGIGLHYYVTVFHPAVASKPPHTSWKFYAIYSVAFFILCLFARIRWVKKQYVSAGNDMTNKKS